MLLHCHFNLSALLLIAKDLSFLCLSDPLSLLLLIFALALTIRISQTPREIALGDQKYLVCNWESQAKRPSASSLQDHPLERIVGGRIASRLSFDHRIRSCTLPRRVIQVLAEFENKNNKIISGLHWCLIDHCDFWQLAAVAFSCLSVAKRRLKLKGD